MCLFDDLIVRCIVLYISYQDFRRPVGLVVWFSLRVWEVPGSTPGRAPFCFEAHLDLFSARERILFCTYFDFKFRLLGSLSRWPVGLVVWFSLRVREVPGSTPGQALWGFWRNTNFLNNECANFDLDIQSKFTFVKVVQWYCPRLGCERFWVRTLSRGRVLRKRQYS